MKQPKELTSWDFPDELQIPDGYDLQSVPDLTRGNLVKLIEEHNNLVEAFNAMAEYSGFADFVDYED